MKKWIITIGLIMGSMGSLLAAPWQDYYAARTLANKAFDVGNIKEMAVYTEKCIQALKVINRLDLVAWRYNNYGYLLFLDFKKTVGYVDRMDVISVAHPGKDRERYVKETKELFSKNIRQLKLARYMLMLATESDAKCYAKYQDEDRTATIGRNLDAIESLLEYITK